MQYPLTFDRFVPLVLSRIRASPSHHCNGFDSVIEAPSALEASARDTKNNNQIQFMAPAGRLFQSRIVRRNPEPRRRANLKPIPPRKRPLPYAHLCGFHSPEKRIAVEFHGGLSSSNLFMPINTHGDQSRRVSFTADCCYCSGRCTLIGADALEVCGSAAPVRVKQRTGPASPIPTSAAGRMHADVVIARQGRLSLRNKGAAAPRILQRDALLHAKWAYTPIKKQLLSP
jgi:hypothetical protein